MLPAERRRAAATCSRLEWLMLGYDVAADERPRIDGECVDLTAASELVAGEHRLLRRLRRPARAHAARAATPTTPSASCCAARRSTCTPSCARSTRDAEGLPERFVDAARARARALRRSTSLERTPALEDACYRLVPLPAARRARRAPSMLAILDRRLERRRRWPTGDELREVLDRARDGDRGPRPGGRRPARARCATATSTRRSIAAAREASTPRWTSTSPRSARDAAARPTATSGCARWSRARSRWRRCSPRACAGPARRCGGRCSRR